MENLGIYIVMPQEAKNTIQNFGFVENISFKYSNPIFSLYEKNGIYLLTSKMHINDNTCNVGLNFSSLAASILINDLKCETVLNAGTCGSFKASAKIAQPFFISEVYQHDMNIPISAEWLEYSDQKTELDSLYFMENMKIKTAVCSSSNSLTHTKNDLLKISKNGATIKEMELSSFAKVSKLFGAKVISIKVVTDFIDDGEDNVQQFLINLDKAQNVLSIKVLEFIYLFKTA